MNFYPSFLSNLSLMIIVIATPCPGKRDRQFFGHNFDKFKYANIYSPLKMVDAKTQKRNRTTTSLTNKH